MTGVLVLHLVVEEINVDHVFVKMHNRIPNAPLIQLKRLPKKDHAIRMNAKYQYKHQQIFLVMWDGQ